MMKSPIGIAMIILLCACGSAPQVRMSSSVNGQSSPSMDFTDPHFYMDDDRSSPNFSAPPQYRAVDGMCLSTCQSRGGSTGYCNRACGY
jgi:hypothetical protein